MKLAQKKLEDRYRLERTRNCGELQNKLKINYSEIDVNTLEYFCIHIYLLCVCMREIERDTAGRSTSVGMRLQKFPEYS